MKKSANPTIANAAILLSIFLFVGRGLGLIRETLFAGYFGLSRNFDLFLVITIVPLIIPTILSYIAQNFFIPKYLKLKSTDHKASKVFFVNSIYQFLFLGIAISLILILLKNSLIHSLLYGISVSEYEIVKVIFVIYSLAIPFSAVFAVLASYSQAEYDFQSPVIAQTLLNVFVILSVLFLASVKNVQSIAYGYFGGNIIQTLYLYLILRFKYKFNFIRPKFLEGISQFNFSFLMIVIIEFLNQLFPFIDRSFYNSVNKGGISALNYSTNLYLLPLSVLSISYSTVMFPKMNDLMTRINTHDLKNKLNSFLSTNIFIFSLISAIYIYFGDSIIKILFQRGNFSSYDTAHTNELLLVLSASFIFYSIYTVLNKLIYSLGYLKQLLILSISVLIIKYLIISLFIDSLQEKILALSTSITYLVLFLVANFILSKELGKNWNKNLVSQIILNIFNVIFSLIIVNVLFNSSENFSKFQGVPKLLGFTMIFFLNAAFIKLNAFEVLKNSIFNIFYRLVKIGVN